MWRTAWARARACMHTADVCDWRMHARSSDHPTRSTRRRSPPSACACSSPCDSRITTDIMSLDGRKRLQVQQQQAHHHHTIPSVLPAAG